MEISVPESALILLIGPSGSGKSTFAKKYFNKHEYVSSDYCRGVVSNDENSMAASKEAFELLHFIVSQRLKKGLLTVVDATNVQKSARKSILELGKKYHVLAIAIVLKMPKSLCENRNAERKDRDFGPHVIRRQINNLNRSLGRIKKEGFSRVFILKSEEEVNAIAEIVRTPLYNNKKDLHGPFDIIGDIHGCFDELIELLGKLGYEVKTSQEEGTYGFSVSHPESRQAIFLGDLVDRGPKSPEVLKLVMSMVKSETALCVPGNHDAKLQRYLRGRSVRLTHGLEETVQQLSAESEEFRYQVKEFIFDCVSHYVLDDGNLVVAHAGIKENMQGRASGRVRAFCLYGETSGEVNQYGRPIRHDWAAEYRGRAKVVYGHTTVVEAKWHNRTIDIDTGCVFGGKLSALRYPEEKLVSVPAREVYWEPDPEEPEEAEEEKYQGLLNIDDVKGTHILQTRLRPNITIHESNGIVALETMSRFAVEPAWLIYLPPTMSPCATSSLSGYLEHPIEAMKYYRERGVKKLVCEEKHMGSRAVVVVCKNTATTFKRFGVRDGSLGSCYTRSGRPFFNEELGKAFLEKMSGELSRSGFWEKYDSDWVCLDVEILPWSAKSQSLLKEQYASLGSAAQHALFEVKKLTQTFEARKIEGSEILKQVYDDRLVAIEKYIDSYRNYCWDVESLDDYLVAPFHILASEGRAHVDKDHLWHMEAISSLCEGSDFFKPTPYRVVDVDDEKTISEVVEWWTEHTESGGEGMVIKPYNFICEKDGKLLQPAIKCRGKEYLRIIYGPEYDRPDSLLKLKKRNLSRKRSLALREFALGVEALERFVKKVPLRKVHEVVFGVLALESESTDPRL